MAASSSSETNHEPRGQLLMFGAAVERAPTFKPETASSADSDESSRKLADQSATNREPPQADESRFARRIADLQTSRALRSLSSISSDSSTGPSRERQPTKQADGPTASALSDYRKAEHTSKVSPKPSLPATPKWDPATLRIKQAVADLQELAGESTSTDKGSVPTEVRLRLAAGMRTLVRSSVQPGSTAESERQQYNAVAFLSTPVSVLAIIGVLLLAVLPLQRRESAQLDISPSDQPIAEISRREAPKRLAGASGTHSVPLHESAMPTVVKEIAAEAIPPDALQKLKSPGAERREASTSIVEAEDALSSARPNAASYENERAQREQSFAIETELVRVQTEIEMLKHARTGGRPSFLVGPQLSLGQADAGLLLSSAGAGTAMQGLPNTPVTQVVGHDRVIARLEPAELPPSGLERLIARAQLLIKQRDIGGARLLLLRAVAHGSPKAAFLLGQTYDPTVLASWRVRGMTADLARARELYARARDGGVPEATRALGPQP
jgi:hypothetical protein